MLVATDLATDTRVLREATTLAAAGHTVHVICRLLPQDYPLPAGITASCVSARSVFQDGAAARSPARRLPAPQRVARWLLLPQHRNQVFGNWARGALGDARTREFDAVHAHDFLALEAAAQVARERGVPLIYDSHEFWSGRPRHGRPTPLQTWRDRRREGRLGSQAAAVITVGEGVATALRETFGWQRVTVVRNTFPLAAPASPVAPGPDDGEHAPGHSPAGAPRALVYAGRLAAYREMETIAEASTRVDLPITLVGPADDTWMAGFDRKNCAVRPALSVDGVTALLAEAGLALVTLSDRWRNHQLALPNKLFHAVRAGVPVVATDVGELALAVRQYKVGTLYQPGDAGSLVAAIEEARSRYPELVANVAAAAREMSWEPDAEALLGVYEALEAKRTASTSSTESTGRRIAMLVRNGVRADSRVRKSATALAEAGFDVTIVGTAPSGTGEERFSLDGVPVRLVDVPPVVSGPAAARGRLHKGMDVALALASRNGGWRRLNPWMVELEAAWRPVLDELAPDVVHAHDFHPVPTAADYVRDRRASGQAARWLYDAHEDAVHTADRGARGPRGWMRRRMVAGLLDEYVPGADSVITVSDELASMLVRQHRLSKRPPVVLNAPVVGMPTTMLRSVREVAGLSADVPLLVYSGGLTPVRGLATAVTALVRLPGVHLVLVARDDDRDLADLRERARALGVGDRLHVAPFVEPAAITTYLHSADIGLVPSLRAPNHEISLSTKYMEYVQARLPLVVSDVRTMAATTRRYGWGEVFTAGDAASMATAVRAVLAERGTYLKAFDDHPDVLRELTWEPQARRLVATYEELCGEPRTGTVTGAVAS